MEDLKPYPFIQYEQGEEGSFYFYEEAVWPEYSPKQINVTDRATILNFIIGLNGYTVCTGIDNGDLVDDVARAGLADGELVFVGLDGVDHLHERLDGEHVVLGGDLAQLLARFGMLIALFEQVGLVEHLAGVGQEFRAVHGQGDALRGAGEDLDAQLVLQFLDRRAQGRLGDVQGMGGLVHRAALDDFDDVFQLQQCHKVYLYR